LERSQRKRLKRTKERKEKFKQRIQIITSIVNTYLPLTMQEDLLKQNMTRPLKKEKLGMKIDTIKFSIYQ